MLAEVEKSARGSRAFSGATLCLGPAAALVGDNVMEAQPNQPHHRVADNRNGDDDLLLGWRDKRIHRADFIPPRARQLVLVMGLSQRQPDAPAELPKRV